MDRPSSCTSPPKYPAISTCSRPQLQTHLASSAKSTFVLPEPVSPSARRTFPNTASPTSQIPSLDPPLDTPSSPTIAPPPKMTRAPSSATPRASPHLSVASVNRAPLPPTIPHPPHY